MKRQGLLPSYVCLLLAVLACRTSREALPPVAGSLDRPLSAAVAAHDALRVHELLGRGRPSDPEKLALQAVEAGDVSVLRLLFGSGFDPNYGSGTNFEGLLRSASRLGHAEVVAFLLAAGADPNGRSGPDAAYPVLWEAVRWNHGRAAAELLKGKGDPNARIYIDLQGTRREPGQGPTLLMLAAAQGDADMVDLLLASGADPHQKDWRGRTALQWLNGYASPVPRIRAALAGATRRKEHE